MTRGDREEANIKESKDWKERGKNEYNLNREIT